MSENIVRNDAVEILENKLYPLVKRTHGLADFLSDAVQGSSLIHLAEQVVFNLKRIESLVDESSRIVRLHDQARRATTPPS